MVSTQPRSSTACFRKGCTVLHGFARLSAPRRNQRCVCSVIMAPLRPAAPGNSEHRPWAPLQPAATHPSDTPKRRSTRRASGTDTTISDHLRAACRHGKGAKCVACVPHVRRMCAACAPHVRRLCAASFRLEAPLRRFRVAPGRDGRWIPTNDIARKRRMICCNERVYYLLGPALPG